MNRKERRDGTKTSAFSLVELLTVIGIVGLLATLLISSVAKAKRRSGSITCLNNVRQHGLGLATFVESHGEYPLFLARPYQRTKQIDVGDDHRLDSLRKSSTSRSSAS